MRDEDYPALFRAASEESARAQSRFFSLLAWNVVLFVLAGALSASNSEKAAVWFWCGAILIGNFFITLALAVLKPEQGWYSARAIAESVKTATWRFMMRAEPFHQEGQLATGLFAGRLKAIFEQNKKFSGQFTHAIDGQQIPAHLLQMRSRDLTHRMSYYRDFRILDQKGWYSTKSRTNWRAARVWFGVMLGAMALAVLLHFWRATTPRWEYWPGDIVITIALSVLTWLQAKRFRELGESYSLAAQEIALVETGLPAIETENDFSAFVGDAENAFSREHTQWVARKDR